MGTTASFFKAKGSRKTSFKMKNTLLYTCLVLSMVTSCSTNDVEQETSLFREWSLIEAQAGFSEKEQYEIGDIIWSFENNRNLKIELNTSIPNSSRLPFKAEGSHRFLIKDNLIQFHDLEMQYKVDGNSLILLKDTAYDGPRMVLIKL